MFLIVPSLPKDSTAVGSLKRPYPLSQPPYLSRIGLAPLRGGPSKLGFCSRKAFVRAFRQDTAKTDRCLVHPAWRRRKTSPNGLTRIAWLAVCPFALRNRQTAQRSLQPQAPRLLYPPATPQLPRRPTLCASAEGGVFPPGGLLAGLTRETPLCTGFFALQGGPPFTPWGSDPANRPSCCLQRTWSLAIAFGSFLRLGGFTCQGSPTTAFASPSRSLTSFPLPIPSRVLILHYSLPSLVPNSYCSPLLPLVYSPRVVAVTAFCTAARYSHLHRHENARYLLRPRSRSAVPVRLGPVRRS